MEQLDEKLKSAQLKPEWKARFLVALLCGLQMLFVSNVHGQGDVTVHGTVTSSAGETLPGVTVVIKGTTIGTTTDIDGNFTLVLPPNAEVLQFSYVGLVTQDVPIAGRTQFSVVMDEEMVGLDEIVVVAYGTQKKTSLTSAVSTMAGDEVTSIPVTNLSNAIGGRLTGVITKQGVGEPGRDGSDIYIRGISTTGSSRPLLIVDGIPRDFQDLDPNSIESFTVLKDAAAVAPYGIGGANGVILVTTKRGKSGETKVSYNGYIGFQNPTVLPD